MSDISVLHHSIDTLCSIITEQLSDANLSFVLEGEKKSWDDLRVGYFKYSPDNWSSEMGAEPTFGCYAFEEIADAVLDIRRGLIAQWIAEVTCALALFEERSSTPLDPHRFKGFLDVSQYSDFEVCMLCSTFTGADMESALEAWDSGVFFTFKLQPGSRFSDDLQALHLPKKGVGFYKKWWTERHGVVRVDALSKPDIVAHARLNEGEVAREAGDKRPATDSMLKLAWGL